MGTIDRYCQLHLTLQYEGSVNYLAFIYEERTGDTEIFHFTVKGSYTDGQRNISMEQFRGWIYAGKACEWNIMKITSTHVTVLGKYNELWIYSSNYYWLHKQELTIKSDHKMLWKECTSMDNCSLPIPKDICNDGQPPQVTNENRKQEPEPSIEKVDVFLGASCFLLTIVVMILTIYIIREKKGHPRETSPKIHFVSNHEEAGPPRSFNQPSQSESHKANPTNPNEHIYEEIDESKTYKHPSKSEEIDESKSSSHHSKPRVKKAGPSNLKEHIYEEIDETKCSTHPRKAEVKKAGPSNPEEPIYEEFDESKLSHRPSKCELQEADPKGIHQPSRCPSEHESVNSLYGVVLQEDD